MRRAKLRELPSLNSVVNYLLNGNGEHTTWKWSRAGYGEAMSLTEREDSDIMSGMQVFTIRDLDRQPSIVLAACDEDGEVLIRRRNGRSYRLTPVPGAKQVMSKLPDFQSRRKALSLQPLSRNQEEFVDRAISGE